MTRLRKLVGGNYPMSLAGFPYVDYHPGFPYSVFLGPGGAQYNTPQMYWADIGTTVDAVYAHTFSSTASTPLDRSAGTGVQPPAPRPDQALPPDVALLRRGRRELVGLAVGDHRRVARAVAIGRAARGYPPTRHLATLGLNARGDLVVWAQEHLVPRGQRLAIDGGFGPATFRPGRELPERHRLPVGRARRPGDVEALLRYAPIRVRWVHRGRRIVAASRGANTSLPVPQSARLHAKRNEIAGARRGRLAPALTVYSRSCSRA